MTLLPNLCLATGRERRGGNRSNTLGMESTWDQTMWLFLKKTKQKKTLPSWTTQGVCLLILSHTVFVYFGFLFLISKERDVFNGHKL